MLVQFVPALVEAIERREERGRIGRVDHDRPPVLGTQLQDRLELRIVDRHQPAILVAIAQPERLVELQSLGPGLEARFQPFGLALAPFVVVDAVEIDQREREEPTGMGFVERGERFLQPVAPAAVQVDDRPHAGRVHLGQIARNPFRSESLFSAAKMVMDVDRGECRPLRIGDVRDHHRTRLPILELELSNVLRFLRQGNERASPTTSKPTRWKGVAYFNSCEPTRIKTWRPKLYSLPSSIAATQPMAAKPPIGYPQISQIT